MPLDYNVFGKAQTIDDYARAEQEFQLKKQLAQAQMVQSQAAAYKAMKPDIDELGQQAFMKAAQGMEISPQELAALKYIDSKQQNFGFNPATGAMEQKPSLLDRAGIGQKAQNPVASQRPPVVSQPDLPPRLPTGQPEGFDEIFAAGGYGDNPAQPGMPQNISPKTRQKREELTEEEISKRRANYTKAQSSLVKFKQQSGIVLDNIDKALDLAKNSSTATGWGSIITGGGLLPGDRRLLDNYLSPVRARTGFDELQSMRDSSPTGGALGQVSEMENRLLQAVNGALDPLQGEQLVENLAIIKDLYPKVLAERERAFQQDYGAFTPVGNNPQPIQEPNPTPPPISSKDALNELRRRGKI